jgi:hypothetical protein
MRVVNGGKFTKHITFKEVTIMKTILKKRSFIAVMLCVMMALSLVFCLPVFAGTSSETAIKNLGKSVKSAVGSNSYSYSGGGNTTGNTLLQTDSSTGHMTIDESEFNKLSSSEQQRFLSDVVDASNTVADKGTGGVDESTVQNWWKELQQKNGVGSKFMTVLLQDTKPDFVAANAIWKPFSGPVGVALGLGAVIIMSLIGIVIVADIAYIALPPVRIFAAEEGGGNGGKKNIRSYLFSYEATNAVKIAENGGGNGGSGESKQALGIYFKRRVWMLIILGICLMYLVNGQIYTLVGWILDLVSGFLHF